MSQKNKKKKFERFMSAIFPKYSARRAIKDIDNDNKHKPKGQR